MRKTQNLIPSDRGKSHVLTELFIIFIFCMVVYYISAHFDILERVINYLRQHEHYELDEIFVVMIFLVFALVCFSMRRWRDYELHKAHSDIIRLQSLLPICSHCKKIRDSEGYWHQVETYINEQTGTEFSHGVCFECVKKHYPECVKTIKKISQRQH